MVRQIHICCWSVILDDYFCLSKIIALPPKKASVVARRGGGLPETPCHTHRAMAYRSAAWGGGAERGEEGGGQHEEGPGPTFEGTHEEGPGCLPHTGHGDGVRRFTKKECSVRKQLSFE